MLNIFVQGNPRPPGGVPNSVPDVGFLWVFYPYEQGSRSLEIVNAAVALVRQRVSAAGVLNACDAAFSRIRGVSFSDLLSGPTVVTIYRHPNAVTANTFALTEGLAGLARHVTLSRNCWGRRDRNDAVLKTAGTLVHELAHCAGAGANSSVAENTLRSCGFRDVYVPGIIG